LHALAGEALPTMSGERLNVFATRMTLTMMKGRVKGAQQGHKGLTKLLTMMLFRQDRSGPAQSKLTCRARQRYRASGSCHT